MEKEIAYTYKDIWDFGSDINSTIWCTIAVYTDGTEEVIGIG